MCRITNIKEKIVDSINEMMDYLSNSQLKSYRMC